MSASFGLPVAMESQTRQQPRELNWSPYDSNGGTCLAVAGDDYCIVAATTRLSTGYTILSRDAPSLTKMFSFFFSLFADIKAVHKQLQAKHVMYQHEHNRTMSCPAMAQLLANSLYYRRFFPYYTSTICAGLDAEGKGTIYSYDVIGHMQRVACSCKGSGETLIQPALDAQMKAYNSLLLPAPADTVKKFSIEECTDLVKDAFVAAGERDIFTGDSVDIYIITSDGVTKERLELKKD